jgi:acetyl esterase/lipase
MPSLPTGLARRASDSHLQSLRGVRRALANTHQRVDRSAPRMETRDFTIPTAAGLLPARLYRPAVARAPGPAMVFFHGGGFVICDLETHDSLCRRLAAAAGLRVLSVDYRLAPEAAFPAQLDDGEAATRWAIDQASRLGFDPAAILVGGDSAGAYIAVAVAARLNAERPGAVAGQALIYPLLELDDAAWASSVFTHSRILGRVTMGYIRAQLSLAPGLETSLFDIDLAPLPPTLIATGGALDPCRPDGRRLAARLRAAGKPVTLLEYPGLMHGFGSLTHISPASRRAMAQIGEATARLVSPSS